MNKEELKKLYFDNKYSVAEIAKKMKCSQTKVNYWFEKYNIKKRSISEGVYIKNKKIEPFVVKNILDKKDSFLLGLGIGLYWGEGNKANLNSVRIGNSDPDIIKVFIYFLSKIYEVDKKSLRFGLQIFSKDSPTQALDFWVKKLNVAKKQFQKVVVTPSRGFGTYHKKVKYGVLTLYFNDTKLRNIIVGQIENLRKKYYDDCA